MLFFKRYCSLVYIIKTARIEDIKSAGNQESVSHNLHFLHLRMDLPEHHCSPSSPSGFKELPVSGI